MKILLLNPPIIDLSQYGKAPLISPCPGTGLSYLYSYLIKYNYNCKIFDFYFDSWDTVKEVLIKENAELLELLV